MPAVTAEQMREVDRIAVEEFGLGILQMMENAGRILAAHAMEMLGGSAKAAPPRSVPGPEVTVLAGSGGNGGGGLCCARHLHNRGLSVAVVLDREEAALTGAARSQMAILRAAGIQPLLPDDAAEAVVSARLVVDALIGYGLRGAPAGRTAELIALCRALIAPVLSLDIPSGRNATTGEAPGAVIRPDRTLTLALPKTGLRGVPGALYLADIGIPPEVYARLGLTYTPPFGAPPSIQLIPS